MFGNVIVAIIKAVYNLLLSLVEYLYYGYLRPGYKKFLHTLTGQCEIERILSSPKLTMAAKVRKLESAMLRSKRVELRNVLEHLGTMKTNDVTDVTNLAKIVAMVKQVPDGDRRQWIEGELIIIFRMMVGYRFLIETVEMERTVLYDSSNEEHETLLLKLWSLLKPNDELQQRISKQWTEIGFQGDDPATDFRGMGVLGLRQVVYFSEYRNARARQLLLKSNHPTVGYPFAIVGISMTALARDLLREGVLRHHFFNTLRRPAQLEDFHRFYCELFGIFDAFWTAMNPTSIMEFVPIRHQFHAALRSSLSMDEAILHEAEPGISKDTIRG